MCVCPCSQLMSRAEPSSSQKEAAHPRGRRPLSCPVLFPSIRPVSQHVSLSSQTRFLPPPSLPGQPTRYVRTRSQNTDSCPRPDRSPEHLSGQPAHSSRHLLTQPPGTGSPPSCLAQETPVVPSATTLCPGPCSGKSGVRPHELTQLSSRAHLCVRI